MEEILKRFEANYRRFLERVKEYAAPIGTQLLMAAQQVEVEAYSEVFGEAYTVFYKGMIGAVFDLSVLERIWAEVKGSEHSVVVDEFKSGFREVLLQMVGLPVFEAITIAGEAQRLEVRLAREFSGVKERRYALASWPIEKGHFTAPAGWNFLGYKGTLSGDYVVGFKEVD